MNLNQFLKRTERYKERELVMQQTKAEERYKRNQEAQEYARNNPAPMGVIDDDDDYRNDIHNW